MYRRIFRMLAIALTFVTFMPMTAGAIKPETTTTPISIQDAVLPNACGEGIDLTLNNEGESRSTNFFNRQGELIRTQTHTRFEASFTLSTTEEVLHAKARTRVNIDRVSGETEFTGILLKINVPGEGGVYRDIGKQVFGEGNELIFVAGQDNPTGSLQFVCDYLG